MQRRRFIQAVTLTTAGLYTSNLFAGFKPATSIGIQLYTVRDALAKDLEGTLDKLAAIGYKNVELFGYNGNFFGKTANEFKAILSKSGLTALSSHHTTGRETKGKGTLTDGWNQAVEDCHTLGVKYMVCAYITPKERTIENYKSLPELLTTSAKVAKTAGIKFAYHNHDFEFEKFENTLVYDYIIKNTPASLVNMEMDLYWISKAGHDPVSYFNKYPGRFPLWHVKDMEVGSKDITEVGHGVINFDKIFAARKKAGLQYWFVEQDVTKGDMLESIKFSHDYVVKKRF